MITDRLGNDICIVLSPYMDVINNAGINWKHKNTRFAYFLQKAYVTLPSMVRLIVQCSGVIMMAKAESLTPLSEAVAKRRTSQ